VHQRGYPLSHQAPQPEQTALPPTANGALDATSPARAAAPTPSRGYLFASKRPQRVNTDRWYYRVFQSAPDLIRSLLPGSAAAANALGLDPGAAAGAAGITGRRPARLPEPGRPELLAGGKRLRRPLCFATVQESVQLYKLKEAPKLAWRLASP
jgi:hypothetical protein